MKIILDMDSSVSPTHGDQEGTAYNGHFPWRWNGGTICLKSGVIWEMSVMFKLGEPVVASGAWFRSHIEEEHYV